MLLAGERYKLIFLRKKGSSSNAEIQRFSSNQSLLGIFNIEDPSVTCDTELYKLERFIVSISPFIVAGMRNSPFLCDKSNTHT